MKQIGKDVESWTLGGRPFSFNKFSQLLEWQDLQIFIEMYRSQER